jgi:hypothetical protein
MKCDQHPTVETTDSCYLCGKAVCPECRMDFSGKSLCKDCAVKFSQAYASLASGSSGALESSRTTIKKD